MHIYYLVSFFVNFILMIRVTSTEYIRSDEITLEDNLETDSQIINLNRLMENVRLHENSLLATEKRNYVFKLVNDSALVNYIDLRYLNDDVATAVIILKKRLDYEDICEESSVLGQTTCQKTLKIIAINENNFIEIPVEIKKVLRPRKIRAKIGFDRARLDIKPGALSTSHLIDYPSIQLIQNPFQRDFDELVTALDFSLSDMQSQKVVKVFIEKKLTGARKIKISVQFSSESELLKAYELKSEFKFRLVVFLAPNMSRRFELINETSHSMTIEIVVRVDDLNVLNLKPLNFEYPIYSVSIGNNEQNPLEINDTVLEPKLKSKSEHNNSIVFSLFLTENSSDNTTIIGPEDDFPFLVDETTGVIRLRKMIAWENEQSNERIFNFGIKASYRNLNHQHKSSYFVAHTTAFAKIQISLLFPNPKDSLATRLQVVVRSEILSPFVSKYEILNEESNNQTLILFINDPFSINSKLIKLHVHKLNPIKRRQKSSQNNTILNWKLDNYDAFFFDEKSFNLTIYNRIEFRDQSVYRTCARLHEKFSSQTERVIAEVNIQFRVDFDPLLFEKPEYMLHVTPYNFVGRNLIRIKLKNRLKSIINNNKHDNVTYRLAINHQLSRDSDQFPFEIGMFDGWLRARKELDFNTKVLRKGVYDLEVIAVNMDLQKSASVKCKIIASCDKFIKEKSSMRFDVDSPIRFSLFDNSPNRTQIGVFKSICSEPETYVYQLGPKAQLKVCSDESKCNLFDFASWSNWSNLFTINPTDGCLMTNSQIKSETLISLVNSSIDDIYFSQMHHLSILISGFVSNLPLTYPIEIAIQSIPHLENFAERLFLIDRPPEHTDESDNENNYELEDRCIYMYQFASSGVETVISRFVRVDKLSMTHLEPEFKIESTDVCSFFVYNNGCLAIKSASGNERKCQVLKVGEYKAEFKLCFYDSNKVSCSPLYNQTLIVDKDLMLSSEKIRAVVATSADLNGPSHLKFNEKDDQKVGNNFISFFGNKHNGFSVYLLALLVVICVIAVVALVSFLFLFLRPRRYVDKNAARLKKSDEKVLVHSGNKFKQLEISTESTPSSASSSGSRSAECSNILETNSDPTTTIISKISKLDDQNDGSVNIQVTDDYLSKSVVPSQHMYQQNNHQNQIKYVYTSANNFNYAGSFSSIGSSSCDLSGNSTSVLGGKQGGLYSVKTASILNQPQKILSQQHQSNLVENYEKRLNSNVPLQASLQSDTILQSQPLQQSNQNPKNSSLRKLKKDLALRKQATLQTSQQPIFTQNVDSSFASSSSLLPTDDMACNSRNHIVYEYLNRKEVILNPANVIASVV